ncbi:hypothetical protein UP09_07625 [Bradyrhizobium sp. LTSP885]|uniref:AlbA family DNA-binding domain-containing protein n=1 Tax=Bradyrhizobium sp. LTSP885 TaxID=1619232 RepID=UPI0005C94707|nr:ATP-binding protein [Bradyrhizobium sp. LTSP885]KJC49093.1 hypothetical protein UP09_07625 [Bradyrhizobium sp. LTSP885]
MPDFTIADRADFQKMVDAQVEETLTIEYKASPALTRDSKNVLELCKDVSAMANSAGGQIIYGIEEDKKTHKPTAVDDGVTDEKITREWMHQILGSNVHPRMDGLTVQRIPLSATGFGFVITVEPTQTGPHQAPDKKYYKRYELEAVAMDDYQIKDIMRRSSTPDLHVGLDLAGKDILIADFTAGINLSKSFLLGCIITNESPAPAYHAIIDVLVDVALTNPFQVNPFKKSTTVDRPNTKLTVFRRTISSPPDVPIFQEAIHESHFGQIALQVPESSRVSSIFYLETNVQSPGFSKREEWAIMCNNGRLSLIHPGHPFIRKA